MSKKFLIACILIASAAASFYTGYQFNTWYKKNKTSGPYAKAIIEIKTYQTDLLVTRRDGKTDRGWGYDIYIYNNLYVHQPYIPAVNGNNSFKTEEDSRKVAELVVHKIRNNIIPPSVSIDELNDLGILY